MSQNIDLYLDAYLYWVLPKGNWWLLSGCVEGHAKNVLFSGTTATVAWKKWSILLDITVKYTNA